MNTERIADIIIIATVLACFIGFTIYLFVVACRDAQDFRRRKERADADRKANEQRAQSLLVEIRAQELARALVAEQRQDVTPISVPITSCDRLQRRRILRPEET